MSWKIVEGEFSEKMLEINIDGYIVSISVEGFRSTQFDWLGSTLEQQIKRVCEDKVRKAIKEQQRKLRVLLGLESDEK